MDAYLYTWNPKKWSWLDLQEGLSCLNTGHPYVRRWSCGNTKKIAFSDVFLLMRLGVEPKGILGCGFVGSAPFEGRHWDEGGKSIRRTILYTRLFFTVLSEEPIIGIDQLRFDFPQFNWTPQSSGTTVPDNVGSQLIFQIHQYVGKDVAKEYGQFMRYFGQGKESVC